MRSLRLAALLVLVASLAWPAITTLDGVIAGMRPPEPLLKVGTTMEAIGIRHSLFYATGVPGAAVAPSPGLAGAALTTYAGQIPWVNPASGNSYLARLSVSGSLAGRLLVFDRLWHNSGIAVTTTTAQTINSAAWPARCPPASGTTPDVNGRNIICGIEVSTATTNAGAITNTTLNYTNESGTSGRTGTISSFPITGVAGTFVPFQLAAGDFGVRSIQTVTLGTSYGGGAIHLVCGRLVAEAEIPIPNTGLTQDAVTLGMPRLYDNTVLFLVWLPTATTAVSVVGSLTVTQG
jgi:hypothetical protein